MNDAQTAGADIELEVAGQKVNVKNVKSLNTAATLLTLLLVAVMAYALWMHGEESKAATVQFVGAVKEQTSAMKEQTVVQREQNCLMAYQGPPTEKSNFCKQVTR